MSTDDPFSSLITALVAEDDKYRVTGRTSAQRSQRQLFLRLMPERSLGRRLHSRVSEQLMSLGAVRAFTRGSTVCDGRERLGSVLWIVSGWVIEEAVYSTGVRGFTLRGAGDFVGDTALFTEKITPFIATAQDTVLGLEIPLPRFRNFVTHHPETTLAFCALLTDQMRAEQTRTAMLQLPAAHRINGLLYEIATRWAPQALREKQAAIRGLTQGDLARLLSLSRPTVENQVKVLREKQVLATAYRTITVLDLGYLRQFDVRIALGLP